MAIGDSAQLGYKGFVGLKEQAAFATKLTAASFMEFTSEGFNREITSQKLPTINTTRNPRQKVFLDENVTGSIEAPLNIAEDAQVMIIKQALGGTVSSAQVGATTAYAHTLTEGDMENNQSSAGAADTKALTFTVRKGGTHLWDYVGCRVNQLTLSGEIGGVVNMSAELVGKTASLSTDSLTASFTEQLPFTFNHATIKITGTAEDFVSFEFGINNNLVSDTNARSLGQRDLEVLPPGMREITLSLAQRFDTTTAYDRFLNEKSFAVVITLDSGATIGAAGSSTYSMVITASKCYNDSNMPQISDSGIIMHDLSIISVANTTTGNAISIQINNATTNY
jgi:hypothetical protein